MEYLSDIELYYSSEKEGANLIISGEEKHHLIKVMRHSEGETIYITDGLGKIFKSRIINIRKDSLAAEVIETYEYPDDNSNYIFCIPKLRSPERFEFALEKSTELGITRFVIYNAQRGISRGDKKDRWEKIVVSAMKQSLRSYKPEIIYINRLGELNSFEGRKIIFEQKSPVYMDINKIYFEGKNFFIFGPEGGLDDNEISSLNQAEKIKMSPNRLRTETAIVKAASLVTPGR